MPYGGDFSARSPGELRTFSFDFAADLASGDYLTGATATLTVYQGADPNANALLVGSPTILASPSSGAMTVVAQQIGANSANLAGFLANVIYAWAISATSHLGDGPIVWTQRIPVAAF